MKDRCKSFKNKFDYKKVILLLGALLLTIGLGNGINNAFASQSIESTLSKWFGVKKSASEKIIAEEITAEKNRLMGELETAFVLEKQRAEKELATFTEQEKQKRAIALQQYADSLQASMKIDLTDEKKAVIDKLDAEHSQKIEDLKQSSTPNESVPPAADVDGTPEVNVKPEVKPESGEKPKPEVESKPEVTPKPEIESKPVEKPTSEVETKPESKPESVPTPISVPESE